MQTLESLFRRFARRSNARWWAGKRPDVREGQLAKAVARQVDLPTSSEDPFVGERLVRLDRNAAAHVLAVAGTTSLAHGRLSPSAGFVRETKEALTDLSDDATFLSNGYWIGNAFSWNSMTSATFDCGVIGFDRENAFIFWVEEED
jgi:hypothetical protein